MRGKTRLYLFLYFNGFFLFLDQGFKYLARTHQEFTFSIVKPWLGWEYLGNPGIAFSIPFPNTVLVLFTPLVLLGLFVLWTKRKKEDTASLALLLIMAGALSNWIDRILFDITIDYIRILTGVVNIADIMIVAGTILLLFGGKQSKKT
jgi:signal peptidase II